MFSLEMSSVAEGSTVIGDRDFNHRLDPVQSTSKNQNSLEKRKAPPTNDFITSDYSLEDRPFFVPIGKDGVIAALQKLDRELLQVR